MEHGLDAELGADAVLGALLQHLRRALEGRAACALGGEPRVDGDGRRGGAARGVGVVGAQEVLELGGDELGGVVGLPDPEAVPGHEEGEVVAGRGGAGLGGGEGAQLAAELRGLLAGVPELGLQAGLRERGAARVGGGHAAVGAAARRLL